MTNHNKSLDEMISFLEKKEREIFFAARKDSQSREEIIQKLMGKLSMLKILRETDISELVLLNDVVNLELDYGDGDIEIISKKIVINNENEENNEISIYSCIGNAIFAEKIDNKISVELPAGGQVLVTILSKNKELYDDLKKIK